MAQLNITQLARMSTLLDIIHRASQTLSDEFSYVSPDEWQKIIDGFLSTSSFKVPSLSEPSKLATSLVEEADDPRNLVSMISKQEVRDAAIITLYGDNKTALIPAQIVVARAAIQRLWGWAPSLDVMAEAKTVALGLQDAVGISPFETTVWIQARRQARENELKRKRKDSQKGDSRKKGP